MKHQTFSFFAFCLPLFCAYCDFEPKPADTLKELYPYEQQEKPPAGFRETPFVETVPEPVPLPSEVKSGMILFTRPITQAVWAETRPLPSERFSSLSDWGAPGQFVTFHFTVYGLAPLKNLKVRSEFKFPMEITRVGYWKELYPTYNSQKLKQYRRVPEYLIPLTVCDAPAKEPQRFMLTCKIPDNAAPGTVTGKIQVFHDGFDKAVTIPLSLRILPLKLKQDPAKHYSAYYYDVRDQHSDFFKKHRHDEALLHSLQVREFKQMLDLGFTRPPSFLLRFNSASNQLEIMNFDKILPELRESGFDMSRPFMLSGSSEYHFLSKYLGKPVEKHYPGVSTVPEGYYQEMDQVIGDFIRMAKEKKYPPVLFNPVDEPSPENQGFLKRLYALFHKHGAKTVFTSAPPFVRATMNDEVDIYSDGSFRYSYQRATSGDKQEYWMYPNGPAYCCKDPVIMCQGGRMTYGFGFWKSGYHQLIPWCWRLPNTNGHFSGRFGNLLLPDGSTAIGLNWICMREGIYDLRYLYTLQDAVVKHENSPSAECRALVAEARELLQDTWNSIESGSSYNEKRLFAHEEFEARRAAFASLILKLNRFPETSSKNAPSVLADTSRQSLPGKETETASIRTYELKKWRPFEREASVAQHGNEVTLTVRIDHQKDGYSKEGNNPKLLCGWPRMIYDFPAPFDLRKYQYLDFDLKVESARDGESNEIWPMWFQAIKKQVGELEFYNTYNLVPFTWHSFRIPLGNARSDNIAWLQFGVSENQYADGTVLNFTFRNPRLAAYEHPTPMALEVPSLIDRSNGVCPISFELGGEQKGKHCNLTVSLIDQTGKAVRKIHPPQAANVRCVLDLDSCAAGNYTLKIEVADQDGAVSSLSKPIRIQNCIESFK